MGVYWSDGRWERTTDNDSASCWFTNQYMYLVVLINETLSQKMAVAVSGAYHWATESKGQLNYLLVELATKTNGICQPDENQITHFLYYIKLCQRLFSSHRRRNPYYNWSKHFNKPRGWILPTNWKQISDLIF